MTKFDFLASLLDFGLVHVVEDVLELLDVEDLLTVQLVSKLWLVTLIIRYVDFNQYLGL